MPAAKSTAGSGKQSQSDTATKTNTISTSKSKSTSTSTSTSRPSRVLYWFRTDLRLTDSPALCSALALPNIEAFYPIWCWDPNYIYGHRVGLNRFSFLLESMQSISDELTSLNPKQKLFVLRGPPEDVLPVLWKSWGITHLVFEKDSNGYAKVRDKAVMELAEKAGVEVIGIHGRHLYDPEEVVKMNKGKGTMTLHQWQGVTSKMGPLDQTYPTPEGLPDPGDTDLQYDKMKLDKFTWRKIDINRHIRTGTDTCYEKLTGPKSDFAVPTMSEMGYSEATTTIKGGSSEGHRRLEAFLGNSEAVATFSKPLTAPTSLEPSTTLLSPYLKFGCVGVREVWWGSKRVIEEWRKGSAKGKGMETKEPENMFGQLEFRDMYAAAEVGTPHFQYIRGNPVCRYIDWGLQNEYDQNGQEIQPRPRGSEEDEERFLAWREGRTGFPWIDACMRQLKSEGWIHHLARHSVACFITRGQCYISWERGMEVFDEWLIDWDPASNSGNWMWLSCSAFFSQYYRVYGLVSWPLKTDKHGELVRKYCPELKGFPDKYIYAPHLAPESVQKSSNCIIGEDYPFPILDEQLEKQRCIARIKNAYASGLHGDSPEVLDGSAKGMLRIKHEESGVGGMEAKSEKEVVEEKGKRKREKQGNMSLDAFVKREKKG